MYTGRRLTLAVLVAGLALVSTSSPASADPWVPGSSSGGGSGGGGFDAWAYWAAATGGQGSSTPVECEMPRDFWPDPNDPATAPSAHIQYVGYELPPGSGHYSVWEDCVVDGYSVNPDLPQGLTWIPRDNWEVEASDPETLLRQALNHLNPVPPGIGTSPDAATTALAGLPTWFWLDGGATAVDETISDGPLSVTITATPTAVTWDPGENGTVECRDGNFAGVAGTDTCSYTYRRSSLGAGSTDQEGRDAYTVSAELEYQGTYTVTLFGVPVGQPTAIGGIGRTSQVPLAVSEAQAINND
jgi:hypothetical protein